jgi:hypothetical protein
MNPPGAQDLGPLFVPPSEPDRFWIVIALLAFAVIAAALVALVRGRLPDALSYPALMVLPLFAYLLGDLQVVEESKHVEFCGSCHATMSPLVESMENDGETLASIHFRRGAVPHESACYRCHGGYGIWGGVQAKSAGLRHMLHTVTGDYEFPLQKVGTFDIASCLDCHAQSAPFRKAETHHDPDIQKALLSGEMGCTGLCHPAPHPEQALMGAAAWGASR